jgi:SAM-dependent methyltransferase
VVAEAAEIAGALVVATDRACDMVAFPAGRWPGAVADVVALPFPTGVFDAALAGFVLNHLAPVSALTEMSRVVRRGGLVLASTWARAAPDPVKAATDQVLARWGWTPPDWYRAMQADVEPVSGDPALLGAAAEEAGLVEVTATVRAEDIGVHDAETVVAYRLAVPQIAPWLTALDPVVCAEVTRDVLAAVTGLVAEWRPAVIVLTGRVPPHPRRRADRRKAVA